MSLKLFAILIGCRPEGRNTEQHDVFFTIATSLAECIPAICEFWPEANGQFHIDGWREVNFVDNYHVEIIQRSKNQEVQPITLFFINLGGYKPNEFEEYHYKLIVASRTKADAIKQSKQTAFYKHTGYKGAESHIDDKFGIDADDVHSISDILPKEIKEKYSIRLSSRELSSEDELNMGYLPISRLTQQKGKEVL
jgi:hypothetical protein